MASSERNDLLAMWKEPGIRHEEHCVHSILLHRGERSSQVALSPNVIGSQLPLQCAGRLLCRAQVVRLQRICKVAEYAKSASPGKRFPEDPQQAVGMQVQWFFRTANSLSDNSHW